MTSDVEMPVEDRILAVLKHLGIEKAHFAGGAGWHLDCRGLIAAHPEVIGSVAVTALGDPEAAGRVLSRLLHVSGEHGPASEMTERYVRRFPDLRIATLKGYFMTVWSDLAVDRPEELRAILDGFWSAMTREHDVRPVAPPPASGELNGITYSVAGMGPPIVLLPLGLSPSQWEPLVPVLLKEYCIVTLSGPLLGALRILEQRSAGLLFPVLGLVERLRLQEGDSVLDVGCGSGVYDRWLARRNGSKNQITAVDINRYFLREAAALARKEGLDGVIEFREGNAEALPFADDSFDAAFSVTVFEEVDADKALAELVRVTKQGGRVGVIVRGGADMPSWVNLPLSPAMRAKVSAPGLGAGMAERGCADASLYKRFLAAGLQRVEMFPQLYSMGADIGTVPPEAASRSRLATDELEEWDAAVARGRAEGTYFYALPAHCAVGTKP